MTANRTLGFRADKGPQSGNTSGFRATGHRLLLLCDDAETVSAGGIVLAQKTVDKEETAQTFGTVIEIGFDAWLDKTTDYCDVGDRVLVGMYSGKVQKSEKDGRKYRFISDLDIITPVES